MCFVFLCPVPASVFLRVAEQQLVFLALRSALELLRMSVFLLVDKFKRLSPPPPYSCMIVSPCVSGTFLAFSVLLVFWALMKCFLVTTPTTIGGWLLFVPSSARNSH